MSGRAAALRQMASGRSVAAGARTSSRPSRRRRFIRRWSRRTPGSSTSTGWRADAKAPKKQARALAVFVDDIPLGWFSRGGYVPFHVRPGEHFLKVLVGGPRPPDRAAHRAERRVLRPLRRLRVGPEPEFRSERRRPGGDRRMPPVARRVRRARPDLSGRRERGPGRSGPVRHPTGGRQQEVDPLGRRLEVAADPQLPVDQDQVLAVEDLPEAVALVGVASGRGTFSLPMPTLKPPMTAASMACGGAGQERPGERVRAVAGGVLGRAAPACRASGRRRIDTR